MASVEAGTSLTGGTIHKITLSGIANRRWPPRLGAVTLLTFAVVATYARSPIYFTSPRFWAEEGVFFFADAFNRSWYASIVNLRLGYVSLWPSMATTLAAHFVSLETAPLVTTLFSFCVQLVPVALVITSQSDLWKNPARRILGVLAVLVTPNSTEVWLNTVNSQFFFAVVTFLILLEPTTTSAKTGWTHRILLVLAGLTGPVSCFLTPLYLFYARSRGTRERWVQTLILVSCSLVQMVVMTVLIAQGGHSRLQPSIGLRGVALAIWNQSISLVFLGPQIALEFSQITERSRVSGWLPALGLFFIVVEAMFAAFLGWRLPVERRITFIGGYLLVVVPSVLFSIGSQPQFHIMSTGYAPRYFYAPNVILMLSIIAAINFERAPTESLGAILGGVLLIAGVAFGIQAYVAGNTLPSSWPSWTDQVARWRTAQQNQLGIAPPGWTIVLNRQ